MGQTVLPPSVNPGRLEEPFRQVPLPSLQPRPSLSIETEEAAPPGEAETVPLHIESLTVTGATVYSPEELEQYWKDRVGQPGTLADLFEIAEKITARYRADGYVLSRAIVPAQTIDNGKVQIHVVEGFIGRVIFEGQPDRADLARATGLAITESRPLQLAELERYLLLMGDQPGISVSSVLRPSDEPGAADLIITFEQLAAQSFATLDNRGTRYVGPVQATVGGRFNSIFGLGDQTFLRLINTPLYPIELNGIDFSNQQWLDAEGTTATLQFNYAQAHPGYTLKSLDLTSEATTVGLIVARPLIRSRSQNLRVNATLVANSYNTHAFGGQQLLLHDEVRSARVAAIYEMIDAYRGANLVGLQLSQGLNVLGATPSGTANLSRAVGKSDYTKLTFDLSRLQSLGDGWSVLSAVTGQRAFTPLLSSEQFGLGGSQFLRAFDPSEIVGDNGVAAKFELQFADAPKTWLVDDYQTYFYADIGMVQNIKSVAGEASSATAASFGPGLKFNLNGWSSGILEMGQPLLHQIGTEGRSKHQPRVFFAFIARF